MVIRGKSWIPRVVPVAVLCLATAGEAAKPTLRPTATPAVTRTATPAPTKTPTPAPTATPRPTATPAPPGAASVVILEPPDGAVIGSDRVNIRGTFTGPVGTGVTVNGTIALARAGRFALNELPLTAGANAIDVVATAIDGRTARTSVAVAASGNAPQLRLTADVTTGFAPLSVTFGYVWTSTLPVTKIAIDFDGDGRNDFTSAKKTVPTEVQNTYTTPGLYNARLTITDTAGNNAQGSLSILVDDEAEHGNFFSALWNAMNDALVKQDVATATQYLDAKAKEDYAPIFQELLPEMPRIVGSYSGLQPVSVRGDLAELAVNRTIDGVDRIFFIYYHREADGVWRLASM